MRYFGRQMVPGVYNQGVRTSPHYFKVPQGHHPTGETLPEALRGNLNLSGVPTSLFAESLGLSSQVLLDRSGLLRGLLGTGPPAPHPSNPPRPPLLRGRFGIDSALIRHRFDVDFLILPYFDAKSTPEGGRARRIREWGSGPVPCKPLTSQDLQPPSGHVAD